MKHRTNYCRLSSTICVALCMLATGAVQGQEKAEPSLAEQARDPTASVTAFSIRYDMITKFHNLDDADQSQIVLQPVIPWKWGNQKHVSRITLPYVTSAPDWGTLSDDSATGLPPNYVPSLEQEGLADIAAVDLFIFDTDWGRYGVGPAVILPTASDPALGSEKLSIGPAYVAITKIGEANVGMLAQWLVSVAGESDRDDVNSISLQPFGGIGFGEGWSVQLSDMNFSYDVERSSWNSLPLGARLEKLVTIGDLSARVFVEYEHNFRDSDVAPADTIRIAFVPLL